MARINASEARNVAARYGFPLNVDFHTLTTDQVEAVLQAADSVGYRKPANANGSRARYFHAYLVRAATKPD